MTTHALEVLVQRMKGAAIDPRLKTAVNRELVDARLQKFVERLNRYQAQAVG